MPLTLTQAAYLSNDKLKVGVIELIVFGDPILSRIPFIDITGNGLTYNVRTTESTATWKDVGDTWVESTSATTPTTAVTHILGGDADVDEFLKATRSDQQDLMLDQIAAKTKAIREAYMLMFYYGYYNAGSGKDPKGFDGLHYLIRAYATANQQNSIAVNDSTSGSPAAGSLKEIEETVDTIKPGMAEIIVASKQTRRNVNEYLNGVGGLTKEAIQGKTVQTLFDIPFYVSDYISNDESCDSVLYFNGNYGHDYTDGTELGNDDNGTTMFFLSFGPEACAGIQSGGGIQVNRLGSLETKDAERVRIKWYPGLMLQNILTCAKYSGISNAVFTVS